jgi:hypothetical protein
VGKGVYMRNAKTHFEQIPVEIVKKIAKMDHADDVAIAEEKVMVEKSRKPKSVRQRCTPERVTL